MQRESRPHLIEAKTARGNTACRLLRPNATSLQVAERAMNEEGNRHASGTSVVGLRVESGDVGSGRESRIMRLMRERPENDKRKRSGRTSGVTAFGFFRLDPLYRRHHGRVPTTLQQLDGRQSLQLNPVHSIAHSSPTLGSTILTASQSRVADNFLRNISIIGLSPRQPRRVSVAGDVASEMPIALPQLRTKDTIADVLPGLPHVAVHEYCAVLLPTTARSPRIVFGRCPVDERKGRRRRLL